MCTGPWSARQVVALPHGWEPLEFICAENNKDVENLPGEGGPVLSNIEAARKKGYVE